MVDLLEAFSQEHQVYRWFRQTKLLMGTYMNAKDTIVLIRKYLSACTVAHNPTVPAVHIYMHFQDISFPQSKILQRLDEVIFSLDTGVVKASGNALAERSKRRKTRWKVSLGNVFRRSESNKYMRKYRQRAIDLVRECISFRTSPPVHLYSPDYTTLREWT
jgi:hypothetical protein